MRTLCLASLVLWVACSPPTGSDAGTGLDGGGSDGGTGGCTLTDATTATSTVHTNGCAVLDRDAASCFAARSTAGLSGVWLKFSCRVNLSASSTLVTATSDGQPDHVSNYFPTANACHETYTGATQNPNLIATKAYVVNFPLGPNTSAQSMNGSALVGLALNGVPIYGNFAAPGDDIFREALTFDRCGGHPQMTGSYHYHGEPYALSFDDGRLIGVMRDGYAIYGRKERDGSAPVLDTYGGHSTITDDSNGIAVYHYHLTQQTSATAGTAGQMQWFLTTGNYRGTPATCTSCN
jgi:hypothetical protein